MNDKSILLIEDNQAIRDSLTWTLEYEGCSVLTASHGQEALDLLNHNSIPLIILLDMMMPQMNGWEFRERQQLNPRLSQIPTVILTARIDLEKSIELHSNEVFIPKPFDVNELIKVIKKYCD